MVRSALIAAVFLVASPTASNLAGLLRPRMELVYTSNGQDQPIWRIDSVRHDPALRAGSVCAVIHQRRRPDQTQPEETRLCLAHDTLYGWNAERGEWRAQRPVGPGMVLEFSRANGDKVRYETAEAREEQISGLTIPVVLTTVTTTDSLSRPKRRLRERYSLGLATATGGVFETPDSSQAGSWRTQQTFELREIRTP